MIETPGQSNQPRYPLIWLYLFEIGYRFKSPEFGDRKSGDPYLRLYSKFEDALVSGTKIDNGKFHRMKRVFDNFVAPTFLFYPLVLGFSRDFHYYAVRGNVRLACLRAYDRLGRLSEVKWLGRDNEGSEIIPCYIKHPDDSWGDDTRVRDVHPWKEWT